MFFYDLRFSLVINYNNYNADTNCIYTHKLNICISLFTIIQLVCSLQNSLWVSQRNRWTAGYRSGHVSLFREAEAR